LELARIQAATAYIVTGKQTPKSDGKQWFKGGRAECPKYLKTPPGNGCLN